MSVVPADLVDADDQIVDVATYADPSRYDRLFAAIRRDDPVHWTAPQGYRPFWTISKFRDIQEIESRPQVFHNEPRMLLRPVVLEEQIKAATGGRSLLMRNVVSMDGKEHSAYRRLTQQWFMPARLKALDGDLRALARSYIDRMIESGPECDFVEDVALWYPLRVIMRIMGVPDADEPKMLKLTQDIFGSDDPDIKRGKEKPDLMAAVKEFFEYFGALTFDRRNNPRDDLATLLSAAEVNGAPIGDLEAMSYYIIVATAGHDTTSSTTAGGLLALIENPAEWRRLREEPLVFDSAIDEMVRWVSPVKHFFRTAAEDYEIRGKLIRKGDGLLMAYPSANRDEDVFPDPFRFDVGRPPSKHLGFGYGPHLCLGQHLAKMEVRIFYEELVARIASVEVVGQPRWIASNFVSGLKSLPIRFTTR